MPKPKAVEVPIQGMDCAECSMHVQHAIAELPGVEPVDVFLVSEKAVARLDPARMDMDHIRRAVDGAGNAVPEAAGENGAPVADCTRPILAAVAQAIPELGVRAKCIAS